MKPFLILVSLFVIVIRTHANETLLITIRFYELLPANAASSKDISDDDLNVKGFVRTNPDLEIRTITKAFEYTQKSYGGFPFTEENVALRTPSVMIELTNEDAISFAALTKRLVGKTLVIEVGGKVRSAPRVMEQIDSGAVAISCKTKEEQKALLTTVATLVNPSGESGRNGD